MLRLSKLADYAVVILLRLGASEAVQTSGGLALASGIPEPTTAKVLKMLAAAGLATSLRGARGGYLVARPLARISVADVIAAVDGPVALTACVESGGQDCEVIGLCALRGRWDVVNDAVRAALHGIDLASLAATPSRPRGGNADHAPGAPIGQPSPSQSSLGAG